MLTFTARLVKFTLQLFGLLFVSLICSGCWPMRFATSPGVTGIVKDAQSHAPVAGAEVFVSRARYRLPVVTNTVTGQTEIVPGTQNQLLPPSLQEAFTNARPPTVVTRPDGRFSIPPEKRWGIYIVPMDVFGPYGTLVIRREGYEDMLRVLHSPPAEIEVGEIKIEKQK